MAINFSNNSQFGYQTRNLRQEAQMRAQKLLEAAQEAENIQMQLLEEEKAEKEAERKEQSVGYQVQEGAKELGNSTLSGLGWKNPIALAFIPATLTAGLGGRTLEGKHIQGVIKDGGAQWKGVNTEAKIERAMSDLTEEKGQALVNEILAKNPNIDPNEIPAKLRAKVAAPILKESQLVEVPVLGAIPKYKFDSVDSVKAFSVKEQFKNFNLKGIIKENTTGLWTNSAVQSFAQQGKSADDIVKLCKVTDKAEIEKITGLVAAIQGQNAAMDAQAANGSLMAKASVTTRKMTNKVKDLMGNSVALRGVPVGQMLLPMLFGSFNIYAASKVGGAKEAGKQTVRTAATTVANCTFSSITSAICAKAGAIIGVGLAKKMNGNQNAIGTAGSIGGWVGSAIGSAVGYFAVDKVVNKVCDLFMGETKMKKMEKQAKEQEKMERAQVIDILGQKSEILKAKAIEELQSIEAPQETQHRFNKIA